MIPSHNKEANEESLTSVDYVQSMVQIVTDHSVPSSLHPVPK
jgi:hypothetical protein